MHRLRHSLRHLLNPLHVYCRLRDSGLGKPRALLLCRVYERLYKFLSI